MNEPKTSNELSNEAYHSLPHLGSTMLATILNNAKKFNGIIDGDIKIKTKAMTIGSALHKIVLEPESFEDEFVIGSFKISGRIKDIVDSGVSYGIYPDEVLTPAGAVSSSKKAKEIINNLDDEVVYLTPSEEKQLEFYLLNKDKDIITEADYNEILVLKEKLLKLENMKLWLNNGIAEKSFFGKIDGVDVKCRPDLLVKTKAGYIVIDLKTMGTEATTDEFAKKSASYLYNLQEAHYREVLRQNGINVIRFLFAGVSKVEWSGASYFEHDITALDLGKDLLQKAIFKYKWCKDNNIWEEGQFDFFDGGFFKINNVVLPNYAFYRY